MRVELGGGPSPAHPEWVQFDAIDWRERTGLRYTIGDIRDLPYDSGSVDELFASNVLEHISFLETDSTLREWRRVLRRGGKLTVVVPDLLGLFRDFQAGVNTWDDFVERVYGSQTYELDLHRAGFTHAEMPAVFERAGFAVLSRTHSHAGGGVTIVGSPKEA